MNVRFCLSCDIKITMKSHFWLKKRYNFVIMYSTLLWTSQRFQKICKPLVFYRFYNMPLKIYIVKLLLALGNIFNLIESIVAQSHDDAKNTYWGINVDFWHCLIVMTFR